ERGLYVFRRADNPEIYQPNPVSWTVARRIELWIVLTQCPTRYLTSHSRNLRGTTSHYSSRSRFHALLRTVKRSSAQGVRSWICLSSNPEPSRSSILRMRIGTS